MRDALLFSIFALAAQASIAQGSPNARQGPSFSTPAACAGMEVVSTRRALPKIAFQGQWWIEGRPGAEYGLQLRNGCPFRVLAVVSVDGLDVLSGEEASFRSRGYVLEAGASAWIAGWRKSQDQVAAFYFSSPSSSYAERVGKGGNVGVIGAAFFQEKPQERQAYPEQMDKPRWGPQSNDSAKSLGQAQGAPSPTPPGSSRERAASSMAAPAQEPSLGTGHGRRIDSSVSTTSFDRVESPFATVAIRYESAQRLVEMGAIRPRSIGHDPFPGEPAPSFVPEPPMPVR